MRAAAKGTCRHLAVPHQSQVIRAAAQHVTYTTAWASCCVAVRGGGLTKVILLEAREDKLQEALSTINHLEGAVRPLVITLLVIAALLVTITLGHLGGGGGEGGGLARQEVAKGKGGE